ncbi:MAG: YCF48-related protein [Pyrinomonadaceae bacterium]
MRQFILSVLLLAIASPAVAQWVKQTVNTTAAFRGLSVVNEKVVWASGTGGTVIRTIDGGKTWGVIMVPGAEKLDFRDIEAFDAKTAFVLSIGDGETSRIYKTIDGGKNWTLQFQNTNAKAFFDAIACWDRANCIAMSDPVDGHYVLISTADGGANWKPIVTNNMPAAKDGEAAFAASGTCLITQGVSNAFIVSGGMDARVFRSIDRGQTWTVANTPIVKGTAGSGIFSIAMRNARHGIIVGGDYENPNRESRTWATTSDGGLTWMVGNQWFGYRSGVTFIGDKILVVGPTGSNSTTNYALVWKDHGAESLNAVAAKGPRAVWAVGAAGVVVKMK